MATIVGSLRPEATRGERTVLNLLNALPDDCLVWPELPVNEHYPDFVVLHPNLGVAVLEVKDWVEIAEANPDTVVVRTRTGDERGEPNPVRQARNKANMIAGKLEREPRLLHAFGPHKGKLKVPWAYAVAFPNMTSMMLDMLGPVIDPACRLCSKDMTASDLEYRLHNLDWRFPAELSSDDVQAIRATLYPELVIRTAPDAPPVGVADTRQEQIAKEGLLEAGANVDAELTPEGERVAKNPVVRLVRGVAGSGKTLVLVMRAKFLAQLHPDWRILVVTFNKPLAGQLQAQLADYADQVRVVTFHSLCSNWLAAAKLWHSPVETVGGVNYVLARDDNQADGYDAEFLAAEFEWMKECGIVERSRYLHEPRTGRGRPLSKGERERVFDIFEAYQERLRTFRQLDWSDVPLLVSKAMDDGYVDPGQYQAILVDEAQDFAPSWFDVLRRSLDPETRVMFMAADANQRIYRKYSWRSLGLHVVGRTRILPRSYRSTYEIMRTAFEVVGGNATLQEALKAEDEEMLEPDLDAGWMRHGDWPSLRRFPDRRTEIEFLVNEIKRLLREGYAPGDIAIFHRKPKLLESYVSALRQEKWTVTRLNEDRERPAGSIATGSMHIAKGLEFRAVFVLQLQTLFDPDRALSREDRLAFQTDELRLLHVAMTRARDKLYMTYQSQVPAELNGLQPFLADMRHLAPGKETL